jgi:hypothetical protein
VATLTSPTDNLETEIQQLKSDLAAAEAARISPADRHALELREQLKRKEQELRQQQELESQAISAQQRALDLTALHELEQRLWVMKTELDEMRRQHGQLQGKIQQSKFAHAQMLREYSRFKQQIGV